MVSGSNMIARRFSSLPVNPFLTSLRDEKDDLFWKVVYRLVNFRT